MRSLFSIVAIVGLGLFSAVGWGWAVWQFVPQWLERAEQAEREAVSEVDLAEPVQEPPGPIEGRLRLIAESPLPPTALVIRVGEELFMESDKSGADIDVERAWVYPPEGLRVALRAEWADYLPGPRAVRVRAFFDGVLMSDSITWGRDLFLEKDWHLPGAEELLTTAMAQPPQEYPTPQPGQSDPAQRPPNESQGSADSEGTGGTDGTEGSDGSDVNVGSSGRIESVPSTEGAEP